MADAAAEGPPTLVASVGETTDTGLRILALRIGAYAAGFVASILIARALGPTGRGLYAYPIALLGIVMALCNVGLEHANVYLAGQGTAAKGLWANATVASVALASIVWVAVACVYAVVGDKAFGGLPIVWVAVAVVQVPLLLQILYWAGILQLSGRASVGAFAAVAGASAHAVLTAALFAAGLLSPFRVLLLTVVANGAAWVVLLVASSRSGLVGRAAKWTDLRTGLVFGLKAHGGFIFLFLVLRIDQILVQRLLGYEELGLYSLAVMLAELLWLLSDPFAVSIVPHQVRARRGDEHRLGFAAARLGVCIAGSAAAVAWFVAPVAIRFLYGDDFIAAVWAFRLLLPGIVALSVYRPLATALLMEGRPLNVTALGLVALTVNLVANLLLLPSVGIVGASIASSLAYVSLAAGYVALARRRADVGWHDLVPRRSDVRVLVHSIKRVRCG
jgi:O-antigen/teichoic acid export membrane protein